MEQKSLDMFEVVRILSASRWLIIGIVLVVAIAAVAYSLLTPEIYRSQASFFAVGDSATELPIDIPGLSGLASGLLGGDSGSKAENFVTVLQSRTIAEELIRQFDLIHYFEFDDADSLRNLDDAIIAVREKMLSVGYDSGSGLIKLSVKSKDKQLSLDMVNHLLVVLDQYNRGHKLTQSKLNRLFLEGRVSEVKGKLDSLVIANQRFQESSKAIHLESQTKALMDAYSTLIADDMKADIELQMLQASYDNDHPAVREAALKKNIISGKIRDLEASGNTPEYLINIGKIPAVTADYLRLEMETKIYKSLFEFLYPQYEAARLSELRDMPTIDILDSPRLAGRRDYPKRALICVISTILGFFFAVFVALGLEFLKRLYARLVQKQGIES